MSDVHLLPETRNDDDLDLSTYQTTSDTWLQKSYIPMARVLHWFGLNAKPHALKSQYHDFMFCDTGLPSTEKETWEARKFLGAGGFGRVGFWVKIQRDGTIIDRVAIKELDEIYPASPRSLLLPKEVVINRDLNLADKEYVCYLRGYKYNSGLGKGRMYMRAYEHGDLDTLLKRYRIYGYFLPERFILEFLSHMCIDLKPPNVFLDDPGATTSGYPTTVVGDFGVAAYTSSDDPLNPKCLGEGTPSYYGPEIINVLLNKLPAVKQYRLGRADVGNFRRENIHIDAAANNIFGIGRILFDLMISLYSRGDFSKFVRLDDGQRMNSDNKIMHNDGQDVDYEWLHHYISGKRLSSEKAQMRGLITKLTGLSATGKLPYSEGLINLLCAMLDPVQSQRPKLNELREAVRRLRMDNEMYVAKDNENPEDGSEKNINNTKRAMDSQDPHRLLYRPEDFARANFTRGPIWPSRTEGETQAAKDWMSTLKNMADEMLRMWDPDDPMPTKPWYYKETEERKWWRFPVNDMAVQNQRVPRDNDDRSGPIVNHGAQILSEGEAAAMRMNKKRAVGEVAEDAEGQRPTKRNRSGADGAERDVADGSNAVQPTQTNAEAAGPEVNELDQEQQQEQEQQQQAERPAVNDEPRPKRADYLKMTKPELEKEARVIRGLTLADDETKDTLAKKLVAADKDGNTGMGVMNAWHVFGGKGKKPKPEDIKYYATLEEKEADIGKILVPEKKEKKKKGKR
ncbi:uncharacterized protein AB675_5398 [Cyphellophora attinorum]|uniref:non-specific serine/threonine protein kinase n=1 Tax=Cyphellophora attinorum TaxID=1664694 RepID=A0A0N1P2B9_9EURO|nr:uncharacterized protein AB675_5398 [Phialophora attinorum]KPI42130.1 hypothetical protein AB675_5398 [Phialophora attinorum]